MSEALSLDLSIDLEAELVSITERQHLNKVHWAVQLVRHALEHRPREIRLKLTSRTLELVHDGDPLSSEEHALLLAVTRGPGEKKQQALADLEARYGVTLLTLLLTARRMELLGRRSVTAQAGAVDVGPAVPSSGYRVRVWGKEGSVRQQRAELSFYCRHAAIPIFVNGRLLNRPQRLERALLSRPYRADDGGAGLVGLPTRGTLTRVRYYKRGVYFGLRQSLPSDARPVEASFDSALEEHEDNFTRSVQIGNRAVRAACAELYADLPALFPTLRARERARVKEIALTTAALDLPSALRKLPLFDTSASSWRLSLDELEALARRLDFLPYLPRARGLDDELPVLTPGEVAAVGRLIGSPVRRALQFRPAAGPPWLLRWARRAITGAMRDTPGQVLPAELLDEQTQALLDALALARDDVRFHVTSDGPPVLRPGSVRRMYLPRGDPSLTRALAHFRQRPGDIDAIAASLLLARP